MAQRREHPYIWATWLPRLLTGENSCEWAVWFKAHYQGWDRPPSDFNQADWMLNHTSLLNQQKAELEARRDEVYVEAERLAKRVDRLGSRWLGAKREVQENGKGNSDTDNAARCVEGTG